MGVNVYKKVHKDFLFPLSVFYSLNSPYKLTLPQKTIPLECLKSLVLSPEFQFNSITFNDE